MSAENENEMRAALQQIAKFNGEHDLDCEEGGPKDRCTPCLATAAVNGRLSEVWPEWKEALDER